MTNPGRVLVAVVLLSMASVSAVAALSPKLEEWGKGPAQWIMTRDETRAWKNVKTDQEAIDFIDLFWARRDPSDGTPSNEYRDEFDSRVQFSDQNFKDSRRRGALTERGRVYIVMGPATTMSFTARGTGTGTGGGGGAAPMATQQAGRGGGGGGDEGGGSFDPTGGRAMGARDEWIWEHKDATKFGMPRILVVFIEDPITRIVKRDTQRNDILSAMPVAIKQSIVSPNMTQVPAWAPRGGLEPKIIVLATEPASVEGGNPAVPAAGTPGGAAGTNAGAAGTPAGAASTTAGAASTTAGAASTDPLAAAVPALPVINPADLGASRFTLVRDVFAIATETKADPFAKIVHVDKFTRSEELGWVARYCVEATEAPSLKVTIRISGEVNGETINMNAPEEELTPDRIKAMPGCWLVRGAIPVSDMDPSTYTFKVKIEDAATRKSYNLAQEFKVE